MNSRYLALWLLVLSLLTARYLWPIGSNPMGRDPCRLAENSESQLACGRRLVLSQVNLYDLELIPGFSDSLAQRIIAKREVIIRETKLNSKGQESKALEMVKGIGPKKASALSAHVDVRN